MRKRNRDKEGKWNQKPKGEQFFVLLLLFVAAFGTLSATGCGGRQSCEMPSFNSEEIPGGKVTGCSIPGCGGCLTSGKGCNSEIWAQSCKGIRYSSLADDQEISLAGCDIRYYGKDFLGCGGVEKSCYFGYLKDEPASGEGNGTGFFYGSTDSGEKMIGCVDGCGGCVGTDGASQEMLKMMEDLTGVG